MAITIRPALLSDGASIVEIFRELDEEEAGEKSQVSPAYVETYLSSLSNAILIAEWEGQFAGLLSYAIRLDLWHAAPCLFIEQIAIKRSLRGKGIGTVLIEHILHKAREMGCAEIALTVGRENTGAQALYRRLGIDEETVCLEKHFQY
jgi:ribosomal protein S18 acetylase RimI-like enzyme